jgi:hypothetical protein
LSGSPRTSAATPSPVDDRGRGNAKALSTFVGHAKIGIALDRYGHLMPGPEEESAGMLHAYPEAQREVGGGASSRRFLGARFAWKAAVSA